MTRRASISVRLDEDGKLIADLRRLPEPARERAVLAVEEALRLVAEDGEPELTDAEWIAAWDTEIARRVKDVLEGRTKRVPVERALARIRSVARGAR